jgi:hypothetical protein
VIEFVRTDGGRTDSTRESDGEEGLDEHGSGNVRSWVAEGGGRPASSTGYD